VTVEEALIQADLIYPWVIQLGAFQDLEDAKSLAKQFERKGYNTYVSSKDFSGKKNIQSKNKGLLLKMKRLIPLSKDLKEAIMSFKF